MIGRMYHDGILTAFIFSVHTNKYHFINNTIRSTSDRRHTYNVMERCLRCRIGGRFCDLLVAGPVANDDTLILRLRLVVGGGYVIIIIILRRLVALLIIVI